MAVDNVEPVNYMGCKVLHLSAELKVLCSVMCVCSVHMCLSIPFFLFWLSLQSDTSIHLFTKESETEEGRRGGRVCHHSSSTPLLFLLYLLSVFVL